MIRHNTKAPLQRQIRNAHLHIKRVQVSGPTLKSLQAGCNACVLGPGLERGNSDDVLGLGHGQVTALSSLPDSNHALAHGGEVGPVRGALGGRLQVREPGSAAVTGG